MRKLKTVEPLSPEVVRDALLLVSGKEHDTKSWTKQQLREAYDYAIREHLHASDNFIKRVPRPAFLGDL